MAIQLSDRPAEAASYPATVASHSGCLCLLGFARAALELCFPLSISLFLISFLFWGPYFAPQVLAVAIVGFFIYWLIRSYSVVVACFVGLARLRSLEAHQLGCEVLRVAASASRCAKAWEWPRHMVIIPNYKEEEHGLARTLDSLAQPAQRRQLVVVMAMEDARSREPR